MGYFPKNTSQPTLADVIDLVEKTETGNQQASSFKKVKDRLVLSVEKKFGIPFHKLTNFTCVRTCMLGRTEQKLYDRLCDYI